MVLDYLFGLRTTIYLSLPLVSVQKEGRQIFYNINVNNLFLSLECFLVILAPPIYLFFFQYFKFKYHVVLLQTNPKQFYIKEI